MSNAQFQGVYQVSSQVGLEEGNDQWGPRINEMIQRTNQSALTRAWRGGVNLNIVNANDANGFLKRLAQESFTNIEIGLVNVQLARIISAIQQVKPNWYETHYRRLILELSKLHAVVCHKPPNLVVDPPSVGTIESLRYCFNQFTADHLPNSSYEAMQTLQVYGSTIFIPIVAASFIANMLEDFHQTSFPNFHHLPITVLGSLMLCGILFYVALKIYDKARPIPQMIRPLANYTSQALSGKIEPLVGRDDIIEKIFLCWESTHSSVRQHPLLVGPPGVGKTVILIEVARRIATGNIPEAIKKKMEDKVVFGGSSALLLPANDNMGGVSDVLERFLRQIRPYRTKVIIALDEIHALMREPRYADMLKSALDTSLGGLPYVIGATTDKEYQEFIACDPARARRFNVIRVNSLTNEQVIVSLKEMVRQQYPSVKVEESVLGKIYQSTQILCEKWPQNKQPEISKRILSLAISTITIKQKEVPSANDLPPLLVGLDNLKSELLLDMNNETILNQIGKLQEKISTKKTVIDQERASIERVQRVSEQIEKTKKKIVSLATKIQSAWDKNTTPKIIQEKKFLFFINYLLPILQQLLNDLNKQLKIPQLDDKLIDGTIKDYAKSLDANSKDEVP